MMPFFLIVNLLVALWVFYDAQKRGFTLTQSILWAIGVFFLLIVFLPLYLIVRRRRGELWARGERRSFSSTQKLCFYCGKPYQNDPNYCPHCGQNLKAL